MGLFDAFGVGGGSLTIQLQFAQVQAGQVVQGQVVFTGGRRAQQITNVTVKLNCTMQTPQSSGQMAQHTQEVAPPMTLAGGFSAQPGQAYQFPFQIVIPPDAYSSTPNLVTYRVSANADIDGEIDPGAGTDLQVFGTPYQPQMPMVPMQGKGDPNFKQPQAYDPKMAGYSDPKMGGHHDPKAGGYDPKSGGGKKY